MRDDSITSAPFFMPRPSDFEERVNRRLNVKAWVVIIGGFFVGASPFFFILAFLVQIGWVEDTKYVGLLTFIPGIALSALLAKKVVAPWEQKAKEAIYDHEQELADETFRPVFERMGMWDMERFHGRWVKSLLHFNSTVFYDKEGYRYRVTVVTYDSDGNCMLVFYPNDERLEKKAEVTEAQKWAKEHPNATLEDAFLAGKQ